MRRSCLGFFVQGLGRSGRGSLSFSTVTTAAFRFVFSRIGVSSPNSARGSLNLTEPGFSFQLYVPTYLLFNLVCLKYRPINALIWRVMSVMEFKASPFFFAMGMLLLCFYTQAARSSTLVCHTPTLADTVALQEDQCYIRIDEEGRRTRVLQIDGHEIGKALSSYQKGMLEYAAVLFYAEWCPFSRVMRKQFDSLSASFPTILHIAADSSRLWPSELSQNGVRSLPTLFVYNKTQKAQFYGSSSLKAIVQFYMERTGFSPISLSGLLNEGDLSSKDHQGRDLSRNKSFRAWIYDDLYLAFAIVFLTMRLLFYLQPKIVTSFRQYWILKETSRKAQRGLLRKANAAQRHVKSHSTRKCEGKYLRKDEKEAGKGVLSVPSWPSSSLAAVALAECSSRGVATEGAHEKFHIGG